MLPDLGEFKTFDGDLFRDLSKAQRVDIIRQRQDR